MDSSTAALMLDIRQAYEAFHVPQRFFLTSDDIGFSFLCLVVTEDGTRHRSDLAGPVQAAPPRVRRRWSRAWPLLVYPLTSLHVYIHHTRGLWSLEASILCTCLVVLRAFVVL